MFPSPQDQVDALIHFASEGLNIRTYGAFYPNDAYGMRMTGLLEQSLASRNMLLQKAVYNPADAASWSTARASASSTTPAPPNCNTSSAASWSGAYKAKRSEKSDPIPPTYPGALLARRPLGTLRHPRRR